MREYINFRHSRTCVIFTFILFCFLFFGDGKIYVFNFFSPFSISIPTTGGPSPQSNFFTIIITFVENYGRYVDLKNVISECIHHK